MSPDGKECRVKMSNATDYRDNECPSDLKELSGVCYKITKPIRGCASCTENAYLYGYSCYVCPADQGITTPSAQCNACIHLQPHSLTC